MGLDGNGYYTLRQILGYNCRYNIVLSDRGRGKSYGTKRFLMEQEGCCMCLYRNSFELASARSGWIDDLMKQGYLYDAFTWEGNDKDGWQLSYDGVRKVYFRALSMVNRIKQETYPDDLNWVWWDEFIPLIWKKIAGVQSEGDALRAILTTIDHDSAHPRESRGLKPLRVLMFANPFTWDNPVLSYFHVVPTGYGIHRCGPDVVVEMLEPLETARPGDAFLGDEVNRNQGWIEQKAFVAPIPKTAVPIYSVRLDSHYYWVYKSQGRKKWISEKNEHCNVMLTSNPRIVYRRYGIRKGLREDEIPLTSGYIEPLKEDATTGAMKFDSINTKYDFLRDINAC